jgi:hypothetical protein
MASAPLKKLFTIEAEAEAKAEAILEEESYQTSP